MPKELQPLHNQPATESPDTGSTRPREGDNNAPSPQRTPHRNTDFTSRPPGTGGTPSPELRRYRQRAGFPSLSQEAEQAERHLQEILRSDPYPDSAFALTREMA